jgi:hypothetical protein
LLIGLVAFVVVGVELFLDGLLATASRLGLPAFVLTVAVSGFEVENLAAGIATNLKGLSSAAAGTFLGRTTFLALGVAGLGAAIAPIRASLPASVLAWAAAAPLPLLTLGLDGDLSRLDGFLLLYGRWSRSPGSGRLGDRERARMRGQSPAQRGQPCQGRLDLEPYVLTRPRASMGLNGRYRTPRVTTPGRMIRSAGRCCRPDGTATGHI